MKPTSRILLLLAPALLALTACENNEPQVGKAPESIGAITLDRTRIGAGQPTVASCLLPTGGQNISETTYVWQGVQDQYPVEEGKSIFAFTAPTTPGNYELTFKVGYRFSSPAADGSFFKELSTTKTYTVEACDALTSFWDDSVNETLRNCPGLQKVDDNTYGGLFADGITTNKTLSTFYTFANGKLAQITQVEPYEHTTKPEAYTLKYAHIHDGICKQFGVEAASQKVKWADGTEEAFDPENTDAAYLERIGQGIKDHKAEIVSVYNGAKTDIRLEVYPNEGQTTVEYMRTYKKASSK